MQLLKRLIAEEDGQGLVEYALIVLLVVFVFWLTMKNNIGNQLSAAWSNIGSCLLRLRLVRLHNFCFGSVAAQTHGFQRGVEVLP